jgi:N-acetyl sugar amidotransferase
MDSTDTDIEFDEFGVCNHCTRALKGQNDLIYNCPNPEDKFLETISEMKLNPGKDGFHAIMGISGGLDSSYLLHVLSRQNLKILAVHVDAGWNSLEAVKNINSLVSKLDIELETVVINWEEIKELQIAYLKSGLINQDVPQDHVFFSSLYRIASENKIKYVISGSNFVSESILPTSWGQNAMDGRQIKAVFSKYGKGKLANYPITYLRQYLWKTLISEKLKVVNPLNYIDYSPSAAMRILQENYNWLDYGGKHRESKFTEYFQLIYLPERFGIDKRKAHLSSLIVSNQITRSEALDTLNHPQLSEIERENLIRFVSTKLGLDSDSMSTYTNMKYINSDTLPNEKYLKYLLPIAIKAKIIFKRLFS